MKGFVPESLFLFFSSENQFVYSSLIVYICKNYPAAMNNWKHPFTFERPEGGDSFQYLGSDGLPVAKTYASYLETCEEFKMKARMYAKDNLRIKNSTLHHDKFGYESSRQMEEEILLKREQHLSQYRKLFDITFDGDLNFLTDCFAGKTKRVRVIKDLPQERKEAFSNEFDKKTSSWFTRYCILSRFIEAVRKIILLKRLEKALVTLRAGKPGLKDK